MRCGLNHAALFRRRLFSQFLSPRMSAKVIEDLRSRPESGRRRIVSIDRSIDRSVFRLPVAYCLSVSEFRTNNRRTKSNRALSAIMR